MRALITGIHGFVGRYLSDELLKNGYDVSGIDLNEGERVHSIDILDYPSVRGVLAQIAPSVIFHLAAQSSVSKSWEIPQDTFMTNVVGTINILEAVREVVPGCKILVVGSAEQTGVVGCNSPKNQQLPPNPYAITKRAQEDTVLLYQKVYGLDAYLTRSYNHSGPTQRPGFLISDLCDGIVQVERGKESHLRVGNLEAVRDFTDVRDVVRAYRLITERGSPGEIYNVGSGKGMRVRNIVDALIEMARADIQVQCDQRRMRPSDTPVLVCDNQKLVSHTGWVPEITFPQTLRDTLEYYRNRS